MKLAFATEEFRDRCEKQVDAERAYGPAVAAQLRERLASMREAKNVLELLTGHPREMPDASCYVVELAEGYRLVLCANHKTAPQLAGAGGIDWSSVSRVLIRNIENPEVPSA